MPVKSRERPNKGIWLDPRVITSAIMSEGLCVYKGMLKHAFKYILRNEYCASDEITDYKEIIYELEPYNLSGDKLKSSYVFWSVNECLIEFFRTSKFNFKVYVLTLHPSTK